MDDVLAALSIGLYRSVPDDPIVATPLLVCGCGARNECRKAFFQVLGGVVSVYPAPQLVGGVPMRSAIDAIASGSSRRELTKARSAGPYALSLDMVMVS